MRLTDHMRYDTMKGTYKDDVVSITLLVSGMRCFEGVFSPEFVLHGDCLLFNKNRRTIGFSCVDGVLDGIYCEFNEKGEEEKTIVFRNGKKISEIKPGKKTLKDERESGNGLFGECCYSQEMPWNGHVFEFKNGQLAGEWMYEDGQSVYPCGMFDQRDGVSLYTQYAEDASLVYCGEFCFDEKEGEIVYDGFGILFGVEDEKYGCVYKGNFRRGKFDGFGSSYDLATGLKKEEGIWKEGVLQNGDSFVNGVLRNNVVSELRDVQALGSKPGKVIIEDGALSRVVSGSVLKEGHITKARILCCMKNSLRSLQSFKIVGYPFLEELVLDDHCLSSCEHVVIESVSSRARMTRRLSDAQNHHDSQSRVPQSETPRFDWWKWMRRFIVDLPSLAQLTIGVSSLPMCKEVSLSSGFPANSSCVEIASNVTVSIEQESLKLLSVLFISAGISKELQNKFCSAAATRPVIQSTSCPKYPRL